MKTTKSTQITYQQPGAGALAYTHLFTNGLSRDQAAPIVRKLLKGELNDPTDKRVKRCAYCGYWWRDDSLRNTKRTCCDGCKTGLKTLQRRQQRADRELLNPKPRKRKLADDYVWWLEYPYWISEYSMLKIGWKHEKPAGIALMDYISSSQSILGEGNSRKSKKHVDYHGDDRELL